MVLVLAWASSLPAAPQRSIAEARRLDLQGRHGDVARAAPYFQQVFERRVAAGNFAAARLR